MEIFGNKCHKIIHGNTVDALTREVKDSSADLIFIDPPYNIGKNFNGHKDRWENDSDYLEWSYSWLQLCIKKLKPTGSLYVMTSTQFMPYFDIFLRNKLNVLSRIVWYYDSSGVLEPILFCVKDKNNYTFNVDEILVDAKTGSERKLIDYRKDPPQVYNSKKVPGNVWEFPRVRYRMDEYESHPTQKPIALLERIIKASSRPGETVLDPFAGSFTTAYVSQQLGRKSISIELQEDYIKIGLRRLNLSDEYKGKKLIKELKTYEEIRLNKEQLLLFEKNDKPYL
ncbi:MAG: adenine-specific DNA-methyltransferase, partial [Bacteroidetes bacterium]|nr:adenine-specific DNA-methyltransferase [Bacteroidota bacterium]